MKLSNDFWDEHKGLLLVGVGTDSALRFTEAGRAHFGPLFAKYGFAITNVTTQERFVEVMGEVTAGELAENDRQLEALLNSPETNEEERAIIRQIL